MYPKNKLKLNQKHLGGFAEGFSVTLNNQSVS